jgi:hypothetical protein
MLHGPKLRRRRSRLKNAASNRNRALPSVITGVRKLYGRDRRAVQEPYAESENGNLNEHGKEEGHQPGYVGCGYPTCRTPCRLDNRNSRLWCAKKINQKLSNLEKHDQHREDDPDGARLDTGPYRPLNGRFCRSSVRIGQTHSKPRVAIRPHRCECEHQKAAIDKYSIKGKPARVPGVEFRPKTSA